MTIWWTTYVLGPFYTLLPRRWRARPRHADNQSLGRAALISGILEAVLSLFFVRVWYMSYFGMLANEYVHYLQTTTSNVVFSAESVTQAGFIAFATHPLTWFILYFGVEGTLRGFAAISTGEAYGTLPLFALDYAYRLATRRSPRPELPLVRDEITTGDPDCDIKIASCRRKPDWKYPFTIRYSGAFFQVIGEKRILVGPRPYVYSLRRLPPGSVARGLQNYDPEDVLVPVHTIKSLA